MLLSRKQIADAMKKAFRIERVEVPELGGSVGIRIVSGTERDAHLADDDPHAAARFLAAVLVDDEGDALYTVVDGVVIAPGPHYGETVKMCPDLEAWPATLLDRLYLRALAENGITQTGKAPEPESASGGST